ncbi:MAG: hypothetical protein BroJett004_27020 [Planctomycetota bacterium]|nr:MAG: hypothetical protein BroJett004_27020 [Planctomycetota bacterium]
MLLRDCPIQPGAAGILCDQPCSAGKLTVATFLVALVQLFGSHWSFAQNCSAPYSGAPRITSTYVPSPTGSFYEIPNWQNLNGGSVRYMNDGGVGVYTWGPKQGLYYPKSGGDWFLFALRPNGENPPGQSPGQRNQPILLADPAVMRIDDVGQNAETWYYITGTSGAPDVVTNFTGDPSTGNNRDELAVLGTQHANFIIYRTKDFYNFEVHMTVFDENNRGWSGQDRIYRLLYLNGGNRRFINLVSPHLYRVPGDQSGTIYLAFSAIENPPPFPGEPGYIDEPTFLAALADAELNNSSIFLVSISLNNFLSWHNKDWFSDIGPRFSTSPAWYAYSYGGMWRYDGGVAVERFIPCSGDPNILAGPSQGQLEQRFWTSTAPCGSGSLPGRGWGHRAWASHTFMAEGPSFFHDPLTGKNWLLYDWNDAYGVPSELRDPDDGKWGNHVAAHELSSSQYEFKSNTSAIRLANNRNWNWLIWNSSANQWEFNGRMDKMMKPWCWGGVAEASAACYMSGQGYFLLFSRNTWDSAAYQIVYRHRFSNFNFASFDLVNDGHYTVVEKLLLRSDRHNVPAASESAHGPASFGSPCVFPLRDSDGGEQLYMAFHAKFESSPRRTIFFKELVPVPGEPSGTLERLYENSTGAYDSDKRKAINVFRRPRCIP